MRTLLISAGVLALTLGVWALVQAPTTTPRSLAELVPAGPLLYLEAKDFAALLRDWNTSPEKKLWLESENYAVFSRSKLYLRLKQAHDEFAQAAGFPADMPMVESVAGKESALALYDIGKLEFLYVTRLPGTRVAQTVLARARGSYEPRNAAGREFYVRVDTQSRRTAAFAATDDYLMLATREDLLAGALALLAGQSGIAVKTESWFDRAVRGAGTAGDLRMVMNLPGLVRSPHFRSYWIQRNVTELRQYATGIADAHRSATEIREERIFIRQQAPETTAAATETTMAEVMRLVPDDAGLYRAWSAPAASQAAELLERKVLAPRSGRGIAARTAPAVALSGGEVGGEADLETRIGEAPLTNAQGAFAPATLRRLLEAAKLRAMLHVDSSYQIPDGVFVGTRSAVVLLADMDWDAGAARAALLEAIESLWTTSRFGVTWVERRSGSQSYSELDGLAPLSVAVRGRVLIVAAAADPLVAILNRLSAPPAGQGAVYAAGFRHARERQRFGKMMALMDYAGIPAATPGMPEARMPHFFSENIASLGGTLGRVESESIVVRDRGSMVSQTVVYRLSK